MFYCEYYKIFKNIYFEKQLQTAASVHSREVRNGKFIKTITLFTENSEAALRGAQKDTNPRYFSKFQENVSRKVRHHLKGS